MRPPFFSHLPSMPHLSKCVHVRQCTRVQQDTSMVWLTCPMPSLLFECVHARLREPSTEPALVREAVRERARRVILAEGTEKKKGEREMEINSRSISTGKFFRAAWCVAEEAGMTCLNFLSKIISASSWWHSTANIEWLKSNINRQPESFRISKCPYFQC